MSLLPANLHDLGFLGQGHYAHGTRQNYRAGCHCLACRSANACYEALRARQAQSDPSPRLVDAQPAREKLQALAAVGVGHRRAATLAGVSCRTVQRIRTGQASQIRASVERAILNITRPTLAKGARVQGYETRHRLESLLRDGYERATLARWLGLKGDRIQLHNPCVTVATALKVRALYHSLVGH